MTSKVMAIGSFFRFRSNPSKIPYPCDRCRQFLRYTMGSTHNHLIFRIKIMVQDYLIPILLVCSFYFVLGSTILVVTPRSLAPVTHIKVRFLRALFRLRNGCCVLEKQLPGIESVSCWWPIYRKSDN